MLPMDVGVKIEFCTFDTKFIKKENKKHTFATTFL